MFAKIIIKEFKKIRYGYIKRCPHCGYSGSGWGDSGECPILSAEKPAKTAP